MREKIKVIRKKVSFTPAEYARFQAEAERAGMDLSPYLLKKTLAEVNAMVLKKVEKKKKVKRDRCVTIRFSVGEAEAVYRAAARHRIETIGALIRKACKGEL